MDIGEIRGRVDFGIITIREDEFEAVLDRFPKVALVEARRRYRIRRLQLAGGDAYTIAVVRCAEQGTTDALNTARDLLEDLEPTFLVVVGIAGGVPAYEFTLGDVVVCSRIADFSVEAVLKDHSSEYALGGGPLHPDAARLAADVRAMVRDGDLAGWNDRASIGMDRPHVVLEESRFYGNDGWKKDVRDKLEHHFGSNVVRAPLVVTGALASSDRLIKEVETLQVWLKIARQIQAVEMESAGVYKAAHGRVPFLAIRGISDVVGFTRHQDWTTYACHSAAAFTRALLLTKPIPSRSTGSAGDAHGMRPSISVGIPGASARAQRIADERPQDWEIRLFSQALSDELAASSAERSDMELGVSFGPFEQRDPQEAISWVGAQFGAIGRVATSLSSLVNVGLADAMGPPGKPGDPKKLVYVANRIGRAYRDVIDWTLRWRCMHADAAFEGLSELGQSAGTRLVRQIEDWNERIAATIRDVLDGAGPLAPGTIIDLSVTINLPPEWEENVHKEIRNLGRQFGVHDDD